MTIEPETPKLENNIAQTVTAMREPPGRLGAIVRRLKQMPPSPPPLVVRVASRSGEGSE
ncbi:MAG: hypothetical protein ACXWLX_14525 [Rhizomicrobium sp.]